MSRYMVNKVMWEVDRTDGALAAFKDDPTLFLDRWTTATEGSIPPHPEGGSLTPSERQALQDRDYGALYGMGVNPFLLWQFARSVSVPEEMSVEELIVSFRKKVTPFGYPDFHT